MFFFFNWSLSNENWLDYFLFSIGSNILILINFFLITHPSLSKVEVVLKKFPTLSFSIQRKIINEFSLVLQYVNRKKNEILLKMKVFRIYRTSERIKTLRTISPNHNEGQARSEHHFILKKKQKLLVNNKLRKFLENCKSSLIFFNYKSF